MKTFSNFLSYLIIIIFFLFLSSCSCSENIHCPNCSGTGKVKSNGVEVDCKYCGGDGYITKEQADKMLIN